MNSSRLNSTTFKFSSPQPPIWVTEAFANMAPKYSYIAEYFNQMRYQFNPEIVAEIEESLPGTQNTDNSRHITTAHQQKILFMMHAIYFADRFRLNKKEIGGSVDNDLEAKVHSKPSSSISDVLEIQIKLKSQIASTAKNLASLLRQHNICSNQLGVDWIECDPFTLSATPDKNKQTKENASLRIEYDLVLSKMNWVHHPELFIASVLDRLEKLSATPPTSFISIRSQLGLEKGEFAFLNSFTIWITANCEDGGGNMPDSFHLSSKCWAALLTCLLGHGFDGHKIAIFLSREKKRNASMIAEEFSTEMLDEFLAKIGEDI